MKRVTIILLLIAGFFGVKAIVNTLTNEPATGVVVVVDGEEVDMPTPTETTTVVVEVEPTETATETVVIEPMEPVVFEPLSFSKGSLKKFAAANGAKVIKLKPQVVKYIKTSFGLDVDKGVKINGDLYIKVGGSRYVIHMGELIKL